MYIQTRPCAGTWEGAVGNEAIEIWPHTVDSFAGEADCSEASVNLYDGRSGVPFLCEARCNSRISVAASYAKKTRRRRAYTNAALEGASVTGSFVCAVFLIIDALSIGRHGAQPFLMWRCDHLSR